MQCQIVVTVAMVVMLQTIRFMCAQHIPQIAVIGAGIGGASSCYFMRSLFGETGANIDIYEASKVGGRLAVNRIGDHVYETGGSVIHPKNKYMVDFLKILKLNKRQPPEGHLGLYDGEDYIFTESSWKVITYLKLFWRYGKDVFRLQWMVDEMLQNFERIYALQNQGYAFSSVSQLLTAMDPSFVNMTQTTAKHYLEEKKFSERFIDELFMAIARVNYGQTPEINAFVGAVSLAGAQSGLWAVYGGNRLVPEKLLEAAKTRLISSSVKEIRLQGEQFVLKYLKNFPNQQSSESVPEERTYDIVIVATPLIKDLSSISFNNFPLPIQNFQGNYHHTVCTLVRGDINTTYFNMSAKLDEVLTTSADLPFNSISRIYPVDVKKDQSFPSDVWKVFSQQPLTDLQLDSMFINREEVSVTDFSAYPHYTPPEKLETFVLYPGLFYTSSIEWAASAMEMSVIAGKNAALLAFSHWHGVKEKIDTLHPVNIKTEL